MPDVSVSAFSDLPRIFAAVFLTAVVIKLMDDALDQERDRDLGYSNWAARLGRAVTPYALVVGFVAAYVDLEVSLVFFFTAYALGMGREPFERLPSGVPALVESALALAISLYLVGFTVTAAALSQLWALQLADDWLDRAEDGRDGPESAVWLRFGSIVALTLAAMAMAFWLAVAAILAATVIWTLGRKEVLKS